MSRRTYLVTGGSGFIGASLVRRLLNDGHNVRVLSRCAPEDATRLYPYLNDIEYFEADIRDADFVMKAAIGVDSILHFAAITATASFYDIPEQVLDVGVKGIINVIDACIAKQVPELVLASSSEAYQTPKKIPTDELEQLTIPDPLNPRYSYAASKIISELMAINAGRNDIEKVLICRPHNVYGPDMGWNHVLPQFILRMKQMTTTNFTEPIDFPIQGTGQETRAFEYIEDFVDGALLMMEKGKSLEIYHIGTDEETTISQAAELVGEYFGIRVKIMPTEAPKGETSRRCPDIKKLSGLGYQPRYTLRDGLPIMAQWYDKNSANFPGV